MKRIITVLKKYSVSVSCYFLSVLQGWKMIKKIKGFISEVIYYILLMIEGFRR